MEVVNKLRIELADEVASLPSGLHSEFPDLAVDWLATVFPDGFVAPVPRLDAAVGRPASARQSGCPRPAPGSKPLSAEQLALAMGRLSALALEADHLEATAAPPLSSFRDLWACSDGSSSSGGGYPLASAAPAQQRLPLMRCRRCQRVLLPPGAAQHALLCQGKSSRVTASAAAQATAAAAAAVSHQREASSLSDDDAPAPSTSRATVGNSRATKGASKRKRQPAGAVAGGAKSKLSKGSGGKATRAAAAAGATPAHSSDEVMLPVPHPLAPPHPATAPLASAAAAQAVPQPPLACPAGSRRQRSAWPTRRHRRFLLSCPILDLPAPLQLNPGPVPLGRATVALGPGQASPVGLPPSAMPPAAPLLLPLPVVGMATGAVAPAAPRPGMVAPPASTAAAAAPATSPLFLPQYRPPLAMPGMLPRLAVLGQPVRLPGLPPTSHPGGLQLPPFYMQQHMGMSPMLGQAGGAPILMRQSPQLQQPGLMVPGQMPGRPTYTMVPQQGLQSQPLLGGGAQRPGQLPSPMVPQQSMQQQQQQPPGWAPPAVGAMATTMGLPAMQPRAPSLVMGQPLLQHHQHMAAAAAAASAAGTGGPAGQPLYFGRGRVLAPATTTAPGVTLPQRGLLLPQRPSGAPALSGPHLSQQFLQQHHQLMIRPQLGMGGVSGAMPSVPLRAPVLQDVPPSAQLGTQPFYLNGMAPPMPRPQVRVSPAGRGKKKGQAPLPTQGGSSPAAPGAPPGSGTPPNTTGAPVAPGAAGPAPLVARPAAPLLHTTSPGNPQQMAQQQQQQQQQMMYMVPQPGVPGSQGQMLSFRPSMMRPMGAGMAIGMASPGTGARTMMRPAMPAVSGAVMGVPAMAGQAGGAYIPSVSGSFPAHMQYFFTAPPGQQPVAARPLPGNSVGSGGVQVPVSLAVLPGVPGARPHSLPVPMQIPSAAPVVGTAFPGAVPVGNGSVPQHAAPARTGTQQV